MRLRSLAPAVLTALVVFALACAEAVIGFAHAGEVELLFALHRRADPTLDTAMIAATDAGSGVVVGALGAVAVLALLAGRRSYEAGAFGFRVAGAVLQVPIKFAIDRRARTSGRARHVRLAQPPIGHTSQSALLAAAVVVLAWNTHCRTLAVAVGIVYVGIVGCSRLYLGAHYPSDVIGAWASVGLWLAACSHLLGPRREARSARLRRPR